ncbi:MAG: S9 family peptidase [Chitinophagaceae bacterium]
MKFFLLLILLFLVKTGISQKQASISFEKWISLRSAGSPQISPDGKTVIYSVNSTDWSSNAYDSEIWMAKENEEPVQLTRTAKGSSFAARFSPDSRFISFLADRGDKTQLYIIAVKGGEALQVTKDEDGISSYEWSPDGKQIAYLKTEPESKDDKSIKERYGAFGIEGEEFRQSHLWLLNFNHDSVLLAGQLPCYAAKDTANTAVSGSQICFSLPKATRLTEGNFTVTGFSWRPDGKQIAFNRQKDPLINSSITADIALLDVTAKTIRIVVNTPVSEFFGRWKPDGSAFVYSSSNADTTSFYYLNNRVLVYDMTTGNSKEIAASIDENKSIISWSNQGLVISVTQQAKQKLYIADPSDNKVTPIDIPLDLVNSADFCKTSNAMVFTGRNYADLSEVFWLQPGQPMKKITSVNDQIKGWNVPVNELVQWKSKDGTMIEGVLLKPANFDRNRKYPLLVVIHGGPTGIDLPEPTPTYVYPIMQWIEKGAVVLRVNYRGSAGYGEKFRSLNVRNLGVGDMWDVMSGVDFLQKQGFVDTSRMGCMGWSQGGYISAFLTTNTTAFKAISVGAGISNWVTYYVNTDITPFTRQYLKADPWKDMNVYLKTSPMTNITKARTPTLIQHGEFDKRVPLPNAYELYRGLQDRNIPSKLIVYKGFGHGITKPKERLAAIWHNWEWFNRYVFGEVEEMPR